MTEHPKEWKEDIAPHTLPDATLPPKRRQWRRTYTAGQLFIDPSLRQYGPFDAFYGVVSGQHDKVAKMLEQAHPHELRVLRRDCVRLAELATDEAMGRFGRHLDGEEPK